MGDPWALEHCWRSRATWKKESQVSHLSWWLETLESVGMDNQSLLCCIALVRFCVLEWAAGPSDRWHVQYRNIPRYEGTACRNPLQPRHACTPPWNQPNSQLLIDLICYSVYQLIERETEFIRILLKVENLSSNGTESHHRRLASSKKPLW